MKKKSISFQSVLRRKAGELLWRWRTHELRGTERRILQKLVRKTNPLLMPESS